MRLRLLLLCPLLALTGCGGSTGTPVPPGPSVKVLPAGRSDLPLQGRYLSPDGFVPPLALEVPTGWSSTRRGDDAFDLGRPGVVVALITPKDATAAAALSRLKKAAHGRVTAVAGTLAGRPATGFEEVGGSGELVASPSGTVTLNATPAGHVRVLGVDVDEVPLLAVVVVPDGTQWQRRLATADELLAGVRSG